MVKKKADSAEDTSVETDVAEVAEEAGGEVTADVPAQATDDKGVRRGLGAPPPGTKGDPSVKPIEPGESG